jgi:hypothetical protein
MSEATTRPSEDPLQGVVEAMQTAIDSAKEGAMDAQEKATRVLPQVGRFASRFVYTTCYTISYGVVFPSALLAMSIPQDNAFVHGLIDGAHAARQKVDDLLGPKQAVAEPTATESPVP